MPVRRRVGISPRRRSRVGGGRWPAGRPRRPAVLAPHPPSQSQQGWRLPTMAVETFGAERLASGAGVLDVAGGKGELAFELLNISGVPVTVVDPRQMRLDKYVRRFRSGLYHRNRAPAVRACARRPPDASLAAPAHLRLYFHAGLWTGTRESRRDAAEASWTLAHATRWSRRGLVEGEERPVDPEETNARDVAYRRPGAPVRQRRALDPDLGASRISNLQSKPERRRSRRRPRRSRLRLRIRISPRRTRRRVRPSRSTQPPRRE